MKTILFLVLLTTISNQTFAAKSNGYSQIKSRSCESLSETIDRVFSSDDQEAPKRYLAEKWNGKVAIVAHGLNTRPSKMGSPTAYGTIVKGLLEQGFHVIRVSLYGHNSESDIRTVDRDKWLYDGYLQYCAGALLLQEKLLHNDEIYLVGFSMGGALFEELMNENSAVKFKAAALFAPAIAIKDMGRAITLLNFLDEGTIIPSMGPADYRISDGISLAAYKALFELEDQLINGQFKKSNIPTLVVIDPNDELVDLPKLLHRIDNFKLNRWQIEVVSNHGSQLPGKPHHLIIDAQGLGETIWNKTFAKIVGFLN